MATKLTPVNLFHTPKDWAELHDWINRHHGPERVHILTAAVMAWNLACKLTEE